jgi:hypothetical protein
MTQFDSNQFEDSIEYIYDGDVEEDFLYDTAWLDFPAFGQVGFQDPASPTMEGIIDLQGFTFFLTIIIFFALWLLINIVYNFYFFNENSGNSSKSNNLVLVPSLSAVTMRVSSKIHNTTQQFIVAQPSSIDWVWWGKAAAVTVVAVGIVYGGYCIYCWYTVSATAAAASVAAGNLPDKQATFGEIMAYREAYDSLMNVITTAHHKTYPFNNNTFHWYDISQQIEQQHGHLINNLIEKAPILHYNYLKYSEMLAESSIAGVSFCQYLFSFGNMFNYRDLVVAKNFVVIPKMRFHFYLSAPRPSFHSVCEIFAFEFLYTRLYWLGIVLLFFLVSFVFLFSLRVFFIIFNR